MVQGRPAIPPLSMFLPLNEIQLSGIVGYAESTMLEKQQQQKEKKKRVRA
jgi:hypothetical protein